MGSKKKKPKKTPGTASARNTYHASGYSHHGANITKKGVLGWLSSSYDAASDIDRNIVRLRERSRDLYMGGALVATGAIKTIRTNVIGAGLTVKPSVITEVLGISNEEADAWQRKVRQEFSLWAGSVECDAARRHNFAELQQLAFLSWLMNGDVFVSMPYVARPDCPYDLRVLLIEADRVCDPEPLPPNLDVCQGIEAGTGGEVVAVHICNQHPVHGGYLKHKPRKWQRVEVFGKKTGRRNVLHIMDSERIGQARGVPLLAPIIESALQLGRYTESELMAAVIASMFTVFISTESPNDPLGESAVPEHDRIDAADERSIELGSGSVVALGPDEKAQIANPTRPYAGFNDFVTTISRQMGAALELPYEILVKQFSSNYSASRAALLEAWKMYKMRRSWFVNDFCQPLYEELVTEAVAKGRIEAPGFWTHPEIRAAWLHAEWYGPTQGQIDPLKEVNAAKVRVDQGFSTRSRETSELTGGDFESNVRQREREEILLRTAGLSIEKMEGGGTQRAILDDEEDGGEE